MSLPHEEFEALPAEEGWSKWRPVPGSGHWLVERFAKDPITIWVATSYGPQPVSAHPVERRKFSEFINGSFGATRPCDKRWLIYTAGEYPDLRDYSPYSDNDTAESIFRCTASKEELCKWMVKLLTKQLKEHKQKEQKIRDRRKRYQL